MKPFQHRARLPRRRVPLVIAACGCALAAGSLHGQEALRYSMTGEAAVTARRHQLQNPQYTVKYGDFRLLLTPSLGLDWNSNVYASQDNPEDDFILRPMLQLNASYPITQNNLLNLNVGVGYDYYFDHSDRRAWRLNAGSELAFDMFYEDFWINFHDRFSFSRDSVTESSIAGGNTGDYGNFENTAGPLVNWDGNDFTASLGYDHLTVISVSDYYDYLDRGSEMFVARGGLKVHPRITTGLEGTVSYSTYDQPILNDNTAYSFGAYADWQPGQYFRVQPRVGYTIYDYRQTSDFFPAEDTDAWYFDITVSHAATEALTYSLSAGRQLLPGTQGDLTDKLYVRPSVTWTFIRDWSFNTFFSYEHGKQILFSTAGTTNEDYDWISVGIGLNHQIVKKLSASLSYRFTDRMSNLDTRDYSQHVISLGITYRPS